VSDEDEDLVSRVAEFLRTFARRDDHDSAQVGMLEISDRTFDAMQDAIARQQLAAYPPDVELIVPNNVCGTLEFDRAREMIRLGYDLAERRLG